MTFVESLKSCFKRYADFNGCAGLSEFWWFMLFSFGAGLVLQYVSTILYVIFALGMIVPSLAVGARRLHDTDRSGWLQLLLLIPLVGIIVMIVFWVQDGKANRYGTTAGAVAVTLADGKEGSS